MVNYIEYWADYSAGKRTGDQVKNTLAFQGGPNLTGVIRYIDAPNLLRTKHTNKAEYDSIVASGLKVQLVFQNTTTDADGGYAAGVANAQRAKAGADYLGYPGIIYFTNDRTTLPSPKTWTDYLDGAASVLGRDRVGAYGFKNAIDAAVGHATGFWQSGRESDLTGHTDVYQWNNGRIYIAGLEADLNKVIRVYAPGYAPVDPAKGEAELLNRYEITTENSDSTSRRVELSGTANAGLVVRPRLNANGDVVYPMWVTSIFAWGSDKRGIGYNPSQTPGYDPKLMSHRRFELPGALWADVEFSARPEDGPIVFETY